MAVGRFFAYIWAAAMEPTQHPSNSETFDFPHPLYFFTELSTEHFLEGSVVIVSADLIFGHGILRFYTSSIPQPLGAFPTSENGAGVGGGGKVGGFAKVAPQVTPQVASQVTRPSNSKP